MSGTIKMNQNSKSYCGHIEHSIHYDVNGRTAPCCQWRAKDDLFNTTVKDYFNSDWLANLKQDMNAGKKLAGCDRCYSDEDKFGFSMRTKVNNYTKFTTEPERALHLTYTNICNKSCNICRPQRSHLIANDYYKIQRVDPDNIWLKHKLDDQPGTAKILATGKTKMESLLNTVTADTLRQELHRFNAIKVSGGEPMMHTELMDILQMLVDENATHIKLNVSTNGSWTKEYLELFAKFRSVDFIVSCDGVYDNGMDLYKLVRYPHSWDWFKEQINLLNDYPYINKMFQCVVHVLNVHNIPEFIRFAIANTKKPWANFLPINGQRYLQTELTPRPVIEQTLKQLKKRDYYDQLDGHFDYIIKYLEKMLNTPKSGEYEERVMLFHEFIKTMGKTKGINYQDYIPWDLSLVK